jgi:branched-chain amino acid transport system substrate-binding protein
MDAASHQLQQTIYLATANMDSADPDDLFKIVSHTPPADVMDKESEAKCKLEPFESTPVYEP